MPSVKDKILEINEYMKSDKYIKSDHLLLMQTLNLKKK